MGLDRAVHSFTSWLFTAFLSTWGILVLAFLDSSIVFSLPFAIDAAVVLLAARDSERFWLYPVLAMIGSVVGAAVTFWLGRKLGEAGLERFVAMRHLKRVKGKTKDMGAVALAALDLVPPPFPFTPFILAGGALDVSETKFFVTLTGVKLLRFGAEALLARAYGRQIIAWMRSDIVEDIGAAFIVIALAGMVFSLYRIARSAPGKKARAY
jgi:membrane protein YqaA with SNARE-associated domain